MNRYRVSYNINSREFFSFCLDAEDRFDAKEKAQETIDGFAFRSYEFISIEELQLIEYEVYKSEIEIRDLKIRKLEKSLRDIHSILIELQKDS